MGDSYILVTRVQRECCGEKEKSRGDQMSILNNDEVPVGLSMAFAQDLRAMERFCNMNDAEKEQILQQAKKVKSKQEMREFVSQIGKYDRMT